MLSWLGKLFGRIDFWVSNPKIVARMSQVYSHLFYLQNHVDLTVIPCFLQRLEKCVTAKENLEADLFSKVFIYVIEKFSY